MKVLITGANGFIGQNLQAYLAERNNIEVVLFSRETGINRLASLLQDVDFVFHFAGVNRHQDSQEFMVGNAQLTHSLCEAVRVVAESTGKKIPVVYTSSIQARHDNLYGISKREAEKALQTIASSHNIPVYIFRLPNVFGKWCRPNYNSAVATFCNNIAHGLSIKINDPSASITVVYVDDVIGQFIQLMDGADAALDADGFSTVVPQYTITVGELARQIQSFKDSRNTLVIDRVGTGLVRALYSTYVSYLPPESFSYLVPQYGDARGVFVEMLKTPDAGQFSFFTAYPGIMRGGHYHHSKTEKFLVIKGQALFKFRNIRTGETYELITSGDRSEVVETVPGWTHDITNIGSEEMIVMLWANEVFDRARPDTFVCPL